MPSSSHGGRPQSVALSSATQSGAATPDLYSSGNDNDNLTPVTAPRAPFTLDPSALSSQKSGLSSAVSSPPQKYFHSRRVKKGSIEKPWLASTDPREKWVTIIPCIGLFFGLAVCGVLIWEGLRRVVNHKYCPVLLEDFSNGFDPTIWTREVEVGGFGYVSLPPPSSFRHHIFSPQLRSNGQFEYTTNKAENSFVGPDGNLHIRSTVTDESLLTQNTLLNLTADGICTSPLLSNCVARTNTSTNEILPPVRSARITTKLSASIHYGRIEVRARLPRGNWLWPAIWLLPVNPTYGSWPASGEIDIVESRGNAPGYSLGGNDIMSSTLHWGPDARNDAWWRTNVKHKALHTTFADDFHTFGLEWSENYIFTYVNSRLLQVLYTNFKTRLWERGDFPLANENGTRYIDPWAKTGRRNTPFDHPFYLVLNVAVGGTNGWFKDGEDGKPWVDGSGGERLDFWKARGQWLETWGEGDGRDMVVESVKMWQQCD